MRYAGFWIRFWATLADFVVQLIFLVPLYIWGSITDPFSTFSIFGSLGGWIAGWLYFVLFESGGWQATPGKRMLGIRVTTLSGERISFGRATGRYFGKILSALLFYIGFIMAGVTDKKQALHDKLAETLVLRGNAEENEWQAASAQETYDELDKTVYVAPSSAIRWVLSGFDSSGNVVRLSFSQDNQKLSKDGLVVGRDSRSCDLYMDDPSVSRRHARIFSQQGVMWMEDLGSSNGTLSNGRQIKTSAPVEFPFHGTVTFGAVELSIAKY